VLRVLHFIALPVGPGGGWSTLPGLLWAKLTAVVVLTAVAAVMQGFAIRAIRTSTPPPPRLALGPSLAALVLAVLAFRG